MQNALCNKYARGILSLYQFCVKNIFGTIWYFSIKIGNNAQI